MKSIPNATPIVLTAGERAELVVLSRSQRAQHRKRQRARIVLMAGDGAATREIARTLGCTIGTASKWRVRFARSRMVGLDDAGERGAEPKYGAEHNARILALLDRKPPAGHSNWTGPLLAGALGDIHVQYVWRFLRAQKIDLTGRKSWCVSNDPDFAAKAADIVPAAGMDVMATVTKAFDTAVAYAMIPSLVTAVLGVGVAVVLLRGKAPASDER